MTPNTDPAQAPSALRIYLRHGSTPGTVLFGRIFGASLSNELAARALRVGAVFQTATLGHALRLEGVTVSLDGTTV